ncbi:hypothetical protein Z517_01420 [Fonsecaea pedrosoi CBS 271.37]|uniref:Uncharacterized protein n=1 Tax=Fonsecaea pedrosoi CBS 271.37 TaxID=1442368 RepID=A0A0D2E7K5_9EURO|nr:uncharacterized protein Z517_01420 [Fonsecaea pedrosoi CBS 271.37]KIW86026.1 hypothetical protein Z517_01420 [Fonsecaea pedrosoi CBS 271.37]
MTTPLKPALDQNCHDLPCPAQIAFAIAVIRSKPPQFSIEEYLEHLRQAIVVRSHKPSTILDFDATMYWKSAYQKAESERLKLADELERLREPFLPAEDVQPPKRQSTAGKRKRDAVTIPARKAKPATRQHRELENDDSDLGIENRQSFLRSVRSLRHSLRLTDPCQEVLVDAIKALAISVSRILQKQPRATRKNNAKLEDPSMQDLSAVFRNVYPSILEGLRCIQQQMGEEGEENYPALSHLTKVFHAFLGRLHELALNEYARQKQHVKSKRRKPAPMHETSSRGYLPMSEQTVAETKEMVRTLAYMITALDVSSDVHCELLEGYMCTILDHVGSILSLLVFADSTGTRNKQTGLLAPRGLMDAAHLDTASATGAATIEGPYLIWILRKGMEFLLANTKNMSEKSQLIFALQGSDSKDVAHGKGLRRRIEETLQNTLLRGVFGDDDDTFYNSLRRDEEGEGEGEWTQVMEAIGEKERSPEWFIGEVWEHLGWDILSGRRDV